MNTNRLTLLLCIFALLGWGVACQSAPETEIAAAPTRTLAPGQTTDADEDAVAELQTAAPETSVTTNTPAPTGDTSTSAPPSATLTATPDPYLAEVSERVQVVDWRVNTSADWLSAPLGQPLLAENQVRTGVNSNATVLFVAGAVVRLSEDSLFTITQTETSTRIQLIIGQVFLIFTEALLPGHTFEIETPSGLAGVRGSYLSVRVTPSERTLATCLEGDCFLRIMNEELPLPPGQQTEFSAPGLRPSDPEPMAIYQFNEWFEADPDTVRLALATNLLTREQLPAACDPNTGVNCRIETACDLRTGAGCAPPPECNRETGEGCELPSGCNPVTGEGCASPERCDPTTGANCELPSGCNRVTGVGCRLAARLDGLTPPLAIRPGEPDPRPEPTRTATPDITSLLTQTPDLSNLLTRTPLTNLLTPTGTPRLIILPTPTPGGNLIGPILTLVVTPTP